MQCNLGCSLLHVSLNKWGHGWGIQTVDLMDPNVVHWREAQNLTDGEFLLLRHFTLMMCIILIFQYEWKMLRKFSSEEIFWPFFVHGEHVGSMGWFTRPIAHAHCCGCSPLVGKLGFVSYYIVINSTCSTSLAL